MTELLQLENLRVEWLRQDIANVILDMPGKSANVISAALQDDLERALDWLCARPGIKGAVMSSAKEKIFVAGADLNAIIATLDWSDHEIQEFCRRGQRLYNRWQEVPFVTVAAVHGACVGGGLELALGCHFVIASNDRRTLLGLPETKLGLIPGWAGTVRLPRLVGLELAIELIASSQLFSSDRAVELGVVRATVSQDQLLEAACSIIDMPDAMHDAIVHRESQHRVLDLSPNERGQIKERSLAAIKSNLQIHPCAANILAQSMIENSQLEFAAACEVEARAMAEVYGAEPSRGLLNHFFLNEFARKNTGSSIGTHVKYETKSVGIAGAGLMGLSIAAEALKAGNTVSIYDSNPAVIAAMKNSSSAENISIVGALDCLAKADLVLECIVEKLDAKQALWTELYEYLNPKTILATNTSALPVAQIFRDAPLPGRCCGIHYCHPQLMQLVEIVRTPATSDETTAAAVQWVLAQRKTPIIVKDSPGFVVNRILTAMLDAAIAVFEQGISVRAIDVAMVDFGFPGGPFEVIDVIGLDTVVQAGRAMVSQGVRQVSGSPLLPMMVRKRRLGRKNGSGFYNYNSIDGPPFDNPDTRDLIEPYQKESKGPFASQQIVDSILSAMLIAATEILDHQVVSDPRHIDIAMIQGLGFPAHHGGLLFWADRQSNAKLRVFLNEQLARHSLVEPKTLGKWRADQVPFYQTVSG